MSLISLSVAPSNTGVANGTPSLRFSASCSASRSSSESIASGLPPALDRDVDLDHFLDARRELVALRQLLFLLLEHLIEQHARLRERFLHRFELSRGFFVGEPDVEPVVTVDAFEIILGEARALGQPFRTTVRSLAEQKLLDPGERVVLDDAQLIVQVLAVALELVVDDLRRALVALDAFAREH